MFYLIYVKGINHSTKNSNNDNSVHSVVVAKCRCPSMIVRWNSAYEYSWKRANQSGGVSKTLLIPLLLTSLFYVSHNKSEDLFGIVRAELLIGILDSAYLEEVGKLGHR